MHATSNTVVIQSQRADRLEGWQGRCCDTVRDWALHKGYQYQRLDDDMFEFLPAALRTKFRSQPVVRADLARLLLIRDRLDAGYERVLWCDADMVLFRDFDIPGVREAFGRECWIQLHKGHPRCYRKIHNAWMLFHRETPVLDFYIDRATQLLNAAMAPVVPQFAGPKLLSAWHNISPFTTEERAGMLSPLALQALLENNRPILQKLLDGHGQTLCALNLSASYEGRNVDGITVSASDYSKVIDGLLSGHLAERLISKVDPLVRR